MRVALQLGSMFAIFGVAAVVEAQANAKTRVEVVLVGDGGDAAALEGSVRELLGRHAIDLAITRATTFELRDVVKPAAGAPRAIRVWIDLREPTKATLFVSDASWERVLIRSFPRTKPGDEVVREQIAHVVEGSVDALLSGATIGISRAEAETKLGVAPVAPKPPLPPPSSSVDAPVAKPVRRAPILLDFSLGYGVQTWALAGPHPNGPNVMLAVSTNGDRLRFGTGLSFEYRLPVELRDHAVAIQIDSVAVRLLPSIEVALPGKSWLRTSLGGGFDVTRVSPRSELGSPVQSGETFSRVKAFARGMLTIVRPITSDFFVHVGVGIEWAWSNSYYYVASPSGDRVLGHPWAVRPMMQLGFGVRLLE